MLRSLLFLVAMAAAKGQFCSPPFSFPGMGCFSPGIPFGYPGYQTTPFSSYAGGLGGVMGYGTASGYGVPQGNLGISIGGLFGAGAMGGVARAEQGLERGFGSDVEGSQLGSGLGATAGLGQSGGFNSAGQSGQQQAGVSFNGGYTMGPGRFGGMCYQGLFNGGYPAIDSYGLNSFGMQGTSNFGNIFPNTRVGQTFPIGPMMLPGDMNRSLYNSMTNQGSSLVPSYNNLQTNSFQSSTLSASDPNSESGGGSSTGISNNEQSERFSRINRPCSCCSSKCKSCNNRGRRATTSNN